MAALWLLLAIHFSACHRAAQLSRNVAIFWLALRRGPKIGIFAGAVLGVVDLAIEPFVVNPAQFILDYPLAFACLGLAGFFRKFNAVGPVVGVVVGGTGRFLSHFTSGVIYFSS